MRLGIGSTFLESETVTMTQLLQLDFQCVLIETMIEYVDSFFLYEGQVTQLKKQSSTTSLKPPVPARMATKKSTLNENSKPSFEITGTDFQTSTYNAGVSTHRARSRSFTKGDVLMGRMPAPPAPSRIGRRELIVPRPGKKKRKTK